MKKSNTLALIAGFAACIGLGQVALAIAPLDTTPADSRVCLQVINKVGSNLRLTGLLTETLNAKASSAWQEVTLKQGKGSLTVTESPGHYINFAVYTGAVDALMVIRLNEEIDNYSQSRCGNSIPGYQLWIYR